MKLPAVLLCLVCFVALPAQADIWWCAAENGRQLIQDKPCGKGMRTKSHVGDAPVRRGSGQQRPVPSLSGEKVVSSRTPIEVGLQRNKAVICDLLNTEKADALSQISGATPPPPGENPKDNLAKIEKQRTRVGCDAG